MASNNRCRVAFLPAALHDMTEIISSFTMLGNRAGAIRLKDKMKKAALQVADVPYSGVTVPDAKIAESGYRMIIVEKYLMFYRVFEEEINVLFYRILNGARNYPALLEKLCSETEESAFFSA